MEAPSHPHPSSLSAPPKNSPEHHRPNVHKLQLLVTPLHALEPDNALKASTSHAPKNLIWTWTLCFVLQNTIKIRSTLDVMCAFIGGSDSRFKVQSNMTTKLWHTMLIGNKVQNYILSLSFRWWLGQFSGAKCRSPMTVLSGETRPESFGLSHSHGNRKRSSRMWAVWSTLCLFHSIYHTSQSSLFPGELPSSREERWWRRWTHGL